MNRGEFSLETVLLIYPDHIFIIRGNHEFPDMIQKCGFSEEIRQSYHSLLIEPAFNRAFSNLPLLAIIDNYYLCLHGGIGPTFNSLHQINSIKRPILRDDYGPLEAILWSDPSRIIDTYKVV